MLQAFKAGYRHVGRDAALGGLEKTSDGSDPNHRSTLPGFIVTNSHAPMQLKNPEFLAARFSSPPKFLLDQWDTKRPRNLSNLASHRRDWITLTCKFFVLQPLFCWIYWQRQGTSNSDTTYQVSDPCSIRRERSANGVLASPGRSAESR